MSYLDTTGEGCGKTQGTTTARLWRRLAPLLFGGHVPCPRCHVQVRLTGTAPGNPAEDLIKQVAGDRQAVAFHWLEGQLAEGLYRAELRQGAWLLDIGVWGATVFRREAASMLVAMRPEFGRLALEDEAAETRHGRG